MKLTIHRKDGAYIPKNKANKSEYFNYLRMILTSGRAAFEIYENREPVIIKTEDVDAVTLEMDSDSETVNTIPLAFDGNYIQVHYNNIMTASAHLMRITEARRKNYPFIILEGHNCKAVVRTSCLR